MLKMEGPLAVDNSLARSRGAVVGDLRPTSPSGLTTEEKDTLLAKYFPDEARDVQKHRMVTHKWLWRWLQHRDWKKFEASLERLSEHGALWDEVTYNFAIFQALLRKPRGEHDDAGALERASEL